MREFQSTYLFRASAFAHLKRRTFYLIAANKKEAESNARRQLKNGEELGKIAELGKQYGDYFFKG